MVEGGAKAPRQIHAGGRAQQACHGRRTSGATWEGDVSLYKRTKIGHGCLGKISLDCVTRQLTLHLVVVVGVCVCWGEGEGGEQRRASRMMTERIKRKLREDDGKGGGGWICCRCGSWQTFRTLLIVLVSAMHIHNIDTFEEAE